MNKYEWLKEELAKGNEATIKVFGNSMLPLIKSGSNLTFKKHETYEIGDIVFCKVKSRYIDAHKITKIDANKGYMIANNHGWENGWTNIVYGKVIKINGQGRV